MGRLISFDEGNLRLTDYFTAVEENYVFDENTIDESWRIRYDIGSHCDYGMVNIIGSSGT